MFYGHEDEPIKQRNRIESPEMYPFIYGHLIFDEGAETVNLGKDNFSISGVGATGYLH